MTGLTEFLSKVVTHLSAEISMLKLEENNETIISKIKMKYVLLSMMLC